MMLQEFLSLYSKTNTLHICGFPRDLEIGQRGVDSMVFKIPESPKIYKVYCVGKDTDPITLEKVQFYQAITNRVARKFKEMDKQIAICGTNEFMKVRVNPIEEVIYSEITGCPIAKSKYINGGRFTDAGPQILGRFRESLPDLYNKLYVLGKEIDEQLGIYGVAIGEVNVKIYINKDSNLECMITDLCTNLRLLTKEKNVS